MVIAELPFFVLLILMILPLVIGFLILMRLVSFLKTMINHTKQGLSVSLNMVGEIVVYLVMVIVIINVILYLIGDQPSGFSIFEYLIEDMLPTVWYTILLYGILANISILYNRVKKKRLQR